MRDTLINDNIIEAFEKALLERENNYLTENELCIVVNDLLGEEDRFSYETFKEWKAHAIGNSKDKTTSDYNKQRYKQIAHVIKKNLIITKKILLKKVFEGENNWQSKSWIIERKFDDWNIKRKTDITTKDKSVSFGIGSVLQDE